MLDTDRRRLLESLLRKIQRACRNTAGTDEDSISAFIARFFHRLLSAISMDAKSRQPSRAVSPRVAETSNQNQIEQPELNLFRGFDTLFNDQVRLVDRRRYTAEATNTLGRFYEDSFDAHRQQSCR